MTVTMALAVFWLSAALLVWIYLGFPLVLALRATLRPRPQATPSPSADALLPRVSYVIAVHNERAVIDAKLANIEETDYPANRLEVILVSDGSNDGTQERAMAHAGPTEIELLDLARVGKNAALDAGVSAASGEILFFSDADSMLEPQALRCIVDRFADPAIGGVAGDYHYDRGPAEGEGERAYWNVDRIWKTLESRGGSVTSATGQIYAIRRNLYQPVPDGVTDDFFVSTGAIAAGLRLVFEPRAIARGPVAESMDAEFRRKVRLMGRGFSSVWQRRALLDPRRTGFYALQLLSHKVLRRLAGVPIAGLFVATPVLVGVHPIYWLALIGQLGFHGLAALGWLGRNRARGPSRLLTLPLFFDMANFAGLVALVDVLLGRQRRGWVPERRSAEPSVPAEGR
jgi:cellulose synthase/poly-beta-1,6-N-acetylglucosamine synthase-like glycosyltransferase